MKVSLAHLFLFILLIYTNSLPAQKVNTPFPSLDIDSIYHQILDLQLEDSKRTLSTLKDQLHVDGMYHYAMNVIETLQLLLIDNPKAYNEKKELEDYRIDQVEHSLEDSNPFKKFCIAEIKLQWAFVKLKNKEEFDAAWNIKQALSLITENQKTFPDFLPNKKTLGLIHSLIGAIPEKYMWILRLIGIDGDIQQGLAELKQASEGLTTFDIECQINMALMNYYILQQKKEAIEIISKLHRQHSDNRLILYLYAHLSIKNAQSEKAVYLLSQLLSPTKDHLYIPRVQYLSGEIFMQKGEYDKAITYYNTFLEQNQGNHNIKDTYYKISLCYWLLNDSKKAEKFKLLISQVGDANQYADKYAEKMSTKPYPNKINLRLRLLTDGGYFEKALQLLQNHTEGDFTTLNEQVEFTYRKARLYHKLEDHEQANKLYQEVVNTARDNPWYYAPNSLLQLGYISLHSNKKQEALYYFKKCKTYDDHPYKRSIDRNADHGIQLTKEMIND